MIISGSTLAQNEIQNWALDFWMQRSRPKQEFRLPLEWFVLLLLMTAQTFKSFFAEVGASDSPCTDVFAGHRPFSEPETRAIADFVMSKKDQIKAFIALHSYSQVWLTPWGMLKRVFVPLLPSFTTHRLHWKTS